MFDARIACPTGFGFDRRFYRSRIKSPATPESYRVRGNGALFTLLSPKEKEVALLDTNTTRVLRSLRDVANARFEAIVSPLLSEHSRTQLRLQDLNEISDCTVNLYGPQDSAKQVGTVLTQMEQYLQHPLLLEYGINYSNPQYFLVPGSKIDLNHFVKNRKSGQISKAFISSEVVKLLDSLDIVGINYELPPLEALQTPLLE